MNAGYSSGWVSECFGVDLVSVEVTCLARGTPPPLSPSLLILQPNFFFETIGDKSCCFVMGSPQQIEDHVKQYFKDNDITNEARMNVTIPKFLDSRKKIQFAESNSDSIPKPHSPTEGGMVARWRARNLAKKDAKLLAASQGELMELVMNKKSYDKKFKNFFSDLLFDPRHGTVKVNGERYIFVRGQSISVEFYSRLQEIFPQEQQVNIYILFWTLRDNISFLTTGKGCQVCGELLIRLCQGDRQIGCLSLHREIQFLEQHCVAEDPRTPYATRPDGLGPHEDQPGRHQPLIPRQRLPSQI